MKFIAFLLLSSFFCISGFAQKVTLQEDVVYKDEVPYCRLVKQGSSLAPRMSVRSLEAPEEELIVAQFNKAQSLYLVSFLESGAVVPMRNTLGIARLFAEDLVYNQVLVNGKVSSKGEVLFLRQHGGTQEEKELIPGLKKAIAGLEDAVSEILTDGPPAKRAAADSESASYETVERNHTKAVSVTGKEIKQDFQTIGRYSTTQTAIDGKVLRVISIWLPTGEKVAEATLDAIEPTSARLVILKNNQVVNLPVSSFVVVDQVVQLATYLSGRFLL